MKVLVTGGGGAAAISFLKTIGESAECWVADVDPWAAGLFLVPAERRLVVPEGRSAHFVDVLLTLCRRHRIDVVVPTVDEELLPFAGARRAFARAGVRLLLSSAASLSLCLDKLHTLETCASIVRVGQFAPLERVSTGSLQLPLIVKPRRGRGSRGVQRIDDSRSLLASRGRPGYLAQEFLPGLEYSVDVLGDALGEVAAAVPRERSRVVSGVSVAGRSVVDTELEEAAIRVYRKLGLSYVANIQFRLDGLRRPTLLEVNPRFSGAMNLTVASGIDMPRLALEAAFGEGFAGTRLRHRPVAMVRHWAEVVVPEVEAPQARDRVLGDVKPSPAAPLRRVSLAN